MKFLKTAIVLGALALSAASAFAEGHEPAARVLTLATLNYQVDKTCGVWTKVPFTACNKMSEILADLYKDPARATEADLRRLDELKALGLQSSTAENSRRDLLAAIEDSRRIFTHVLKDHDGLFQDDICGPDGLPIKKSSSS